MILRKGNNLVNVDEGYTAGRERNSQFEKGSGRYVCHAIGLQTFVPRLKYCTVNNRMKLTDRIYTT